jgi:hypothetical protein
MEFPDIGSGMTDEEVFAYARSVRLGLSEQEQKILHALAIIHHKSDDVLVIEVIVEYLGKMFREGRIPAKSAELEGPGASEFTPAERQIKL